MVRLSRKPIAATKLLLAISAGMMIAVACEVRRIPCIYEVPDGFTGWVLIEYGHTNYPAIPVRDGKRFVSIGADGRLLTSTRLETGWATDKYYYAGPDHKRLPVTTSGGGGLIWGASTGFTQTQAGLGVEYENFFVGTEAQYRKAGDRPRP